MYYTQIEYSKIKKFQQEYIEQYLKWSYHFQQLQYSDRKDLLGHLNLVVMEIIKDKKYLSKNKIKEWCMGRFKFQSWKFIRHLRNNNNIYKMTELTREQHVIIDALSADAEIEPNESKTPYYEWESIKSLTSLEQTVLVLRVSDCDHTYAEIKNIMNYTGTTSTLRKIYEIAIKKLRNNPALRAEYEGF